MRLIFTLIFLIAAQNSFAQDERFFRKLFAGELRNRAEVEKPDETRFITASDFYQYDMNKDGRIESIVTVKKNGGDWLHIHNYKGEVIYRTELQTKGIDSWLYKMSIRNISPQTRVFILYFYQGSVEYLEFRAQARVYFLTMDNNDMDSLKLYVGPAMFDEYESFKKHYHVRPYKVDLIDFNKDGVKEIMIKYHENQWVYLYKYPGKWYEL